MKANELRIGNWVMGKYPQMVAYLGDTIGLHNEIGGIDKYQKNPIISYDIDDLEPIPLTPEILEKCGFEAGKKDDEYHDTAFYLRNSSGILCLEDDGSIGLSGNNDALHWASTSEVCKYVHQLQNLYFALTGEELNVEL